MQNANLRRERLRWTELLMLVRWVVLEGYD
jgi:hypothetical protein